jgi:hypothetical protein
MSPINFDILQADYPEYAAVWAALREWFDRNWRKQYVELTVLVRALKDVEPTDLLAALHIMIRQGMLAVAYRVKAPGGYLLEEEFDEPDQIPDEVWDRDSSRKIPADETELVSGYRWEPTYVSQR